MSVTEPTFQTAEYEDQLGATLDFRGLRMPALTLDQMLAGAVAFTDSSAEPMIPCDAVQLQVDDATGFLVIYATDRVSAYEEFAEVNVEPGAAGAFLLHRDDVRTLRSLLKNSLKACEKVSRSVLPVDLMWDDAGVLEVRCEDRRATFTERDHEDDQPFPELASRFRKADDAAESTTADVLDVAINAEYLARLKALQKVHGVFRFRRGRGSTKKGEPCYASVLVTPLNRPAYADDEPGRVLRLLLMPVRATEAST